MLRILPLLLALLLPGLAGAGELPAAEDLLKRATADRDFTSSIQTLSLQQSKGDDLGATVRVRSWIRQFDDGTRVARMEVDAPSDYAGMRMLTVEPGPDSERPGGSWVLWPGQKEVTEGNVYNPRAAFLRTDFAMEDMRMDQFDEGTHTTTGEGWLRVGDKDVAVWRIEIVPDADAGSAYTRVLAQLDKVDLLPRRVELLGKGGKAFKELTMLRTEVVDGVVLPMESEMKNLRRGTQTILTIDSIELDVAAARVPDSIFTPASLLEPAP
jgi:hypothetical protein